MQYTADSKVILVTGGSRGIGRALALSLATHGHRIAITGRNSSSLEAMRKLLSENNLAIASDVSDESAVEATVEQVLGHFGHIDVLINNAGTAGPGGPTWTTPSQDWWHVLETNVKGPLLYMNSVVPRMMERNRGTIINIGSYAALRPTPGNSAYASSKAALARITDSLAAEVSEHNVQVFCLSPGLVRTDMTEGVPVFQDIPEDEWNKPEDICRLVRLLLSGGYGELSGRFIHVRDDLDQLCQHVERIRAERLYQPGMASLDGSIE